MPEPDDALRDFAKDAGWGRASFEAVAGDLSARSYFRLKEGGQSAILMDSRSDPDVAQRFVRVGDWLTVSGVSGPAILFGRENDGLLLCEDFGTSSATKLLASDPAFEAEFATAAVELLLTLRNSIPPDLPCPDPRDFAAMTSLADDFYPGAGGQALALFRDCLQDILSTLEGPATVSLRDFHADNVLWLANRQGVRRMGLIDFQDAFLAHPVYDLVSLLTDARTEVPRDRRARVIESYARRSGDDLRALLPAFSAYSAQRNLRILGIFHRAAAQGRPQHLPKVPRVRRYLVEALDHPQFDAVRDATLAALPEGVPA